MSTLTLTRGDSRTLTVTVVDAFGVAVNLTGILGLWFTVKAHANDLDTAAVIQKSLGAGIAVTDAAGGVATITLTAAETTGIAGFYDWDLQVKAASGIVTTLDRGSVMFTEDVTVTTTP